MRALLDDIRYLLQPDLRIKQLKVVARENRLKLKARINLENDPVSKLDFELFKGRSGKRLKAILYIPVKGIEGAIRVYDFHYFGDLGTSTTTVFEYHNKKFRLPSFRIKPKSSSLFKSFFEEDSPVIQTATPEFQERYTIQTSDAFQLKETLTEEFLDRIGDEESWAMEGKGPALIQYQYKSQLPVNKLMERVERFAHLLYDLENGKTFIN